MNYRHRRAALGAGLLLASTLCAAQTPEQDLSVPDLEAPVIVPALPSREEPVTACYRAAQRGTAGGSGTGTGQDAYVCDLAVQMARDRAAGADGGSPAALAAALTNRSLVLMRSGRLEPALADLEEALGLTPDDPRLVGNRGNLLLRMNRLQEALAAHDRAVTLAPRDPTGYYNRAFVYRALGEPALAAEDVARARQLLTPVTRSDIGGRDAGRDR